MQQSVTSVLNITFEMRIVTVSYWRVQQRSLDYWVIDNGFPLFCT